MDLLSQKTGRRKQGVRLISGDKQLTVFLDRTNTEIVVDSKGSVTIKGSRSVSVEAGTDLTLSARRSVSIKSGGPLTLQGRGLVNLRSLGGAVSVNALGALDMKAAGVATLSATGAVAINSVANVNLTGIRVGLQGRVRQQRQVPAPGMTVRRRRQVAP